MQVSWTVKKTTEFRDIQVGDEMQKKADLGWFDEEFTMYGCAYYLPKKEKVFYIVSPKAGEVYQSIEDAGLNRVYMSNVEYLTRKCPVPSGLREQIAREVKLQLAKMLQREYPKEFFLCLEKLSVAADVNTEATELFLREQISMLESCFDATKLNQFRAVLDDCYRRKLLRIQSYENMKQWLHGEMRNFENDEISKERFEKTLYGLVVEKNNTLTTVVNAQKEAIYAKYYSLVMENVNVAPVFSKTYWSKSGSQLNEIKEQFRVEMIQAYDSAYMGELAQIRRAERTESENRFATELAQQVSQKFGARAYQTFQRYASMWRFQLNQ